MAVNPNKNRPINIGDVFWVKDRCWQRKVTSVMDNVILYHDGIGYGSCSRQHFLVKCPWKTEVTARMVEIAQETAAGKYQIYLDTVNAVYI